MVGCSSKAMFPLVLWGVFKIDVCRSRSAKVNIYFYFAVFKADHSVKLRVYLSFCLFAVLEGSQADQSPSIGISLCCKHRLTKYLQKNNLVLLCSLGSRMCWRNEVCVQESQLSRAQGFDWQQVMDWLLWNQSLLLFCCRLLSVSHMLEDVLVSGVDMCVFCSFVSNSEYFSLSV